MLHINGEKVAEYYIVKDGVKEKVNNLYKVTNGICEKIYTSRSYKATWTCIDSFNSSDVIGDTYNCYAPVTSNNSSNSNSISVRESNFMLKENDDISVCVAVSTTQEISDSESVDFYFKLYSDSTVLLDETITLYSNDDKTTKTFNITVKNAGNLKVEFNFNSNSTSINSMKINALTINHNELQNKE